MQNNTLDNEINYFKGGSNMFSEFDNIIGYKRIKEQLNMICDVVVNFHKYEKLGVSFPGGLLLEGRPGVGKTLMASCFIEASNLKAYVCRKNKPNGDFVDEIKKVFEQAKKNAPSIVLLDDMDKFANEDYKHVDAEEYVTVQACMDEIKGKGVFVIATVNDIYKIPNSLKRAGRFDNKIYVNIPSGNDAIKIVEHYMSKLTNVENISAHEVANLLGDNSCALLETVINKAGVYAGYYGKDKIQMEDIVEAFLDVKYDICKSYITQEAKYVSVHEAGHVVMMELLFPGTTTLALLNNACNTDQGLVSRTSDDIGMIPYNREEYEIMVALAGKAAIELKYGVADVGCNNDLKNAYSIAEGLVDDVCAYGFDTFLRNGSGNQLRDKRDYMISRLIEKYYSKTIRILEANQDYVDAIAEALLEKKVLLRVDFDKIKEKFIVNNQMIEKML